ncbi:hypothetical protein B0H16DRAFT_1852737 [Mycena metata]|uniref:dolichol kinase n=1 Tax=Mycena metata TaxID=1033252 RepID=A0AAD7N5N6_9AGAR|nr:hypothetical protein B0H16DRAFT_1852737 [Mycena metata]
MDSRRAGESVVLLGSLLLATLRIAKEPGEGEYNIWIAYELYVLLLAALLYLVHTYTTVSDRAVPLPPPPLAHLHHHPHLHNNSSLNAKRSRPDSDKFGFIWMSVPKNYRDSADDGLLTALLLGPLIAAALLCTALALNAPPPPSPTAASNAGLPLNWAIEAPLRLHGLQGLTPTAALLRARYNVVSLATLTSAVLLLHVCASKWWEARVAARAAPQPTLNSTGSLIGTSEGERRSVPRSELWRAVYFVLFAVGVAGTAVGVRLVLGLFAGTGKEGVWMHLTPFDILASTLFYQFTLYVALRMAHRGFTLGELGLVCFGGTAVFMEFLNITSARIWPITTPYLRTYRLPTPLVTFQTALIAGPFLTGFLLAPLLVLSRHAAQTPARRRRWLSPAHALAARRRLALAASAGVVIIVLGPLGLWMRWVLGGRDPWVWAVRWLLSKRRRVALLAWWAGIGSVSVAGWMRQLARTRRAAGMSMSMGGAGRPPGMGMGMPSMSLGSMGMGLGSMGGMSINLASMGMGGMMGANTTTAANGNANTHVNGSGAGIGDATSAPTPASALFAASGEFLDRAPTLRLNARRKFFHALVVVMFVPGVAFDPAFTHLAFSAAFALFVFAEYIRYFAIYPLGAAVHLFMNEFLDAKDGGTAILSHFYLLTGCAGAVWLEGPSPLLHFTGILVLGIGDALASIVGKRHGRHAWSPTTPKTLEGTAAFVGSVVASAWALRLSGLAEPFSTPLYVLVVALAGVLEALSDQNDNLTLPLYTWSALTLVGVSS